MGRRKYQLFGKQHGRNMIISYYIYLRCREKDPNKESLPLFVDEKTVEKHPLKYPSFRKRKQVSSHGQVIKDFSKHWPYCEWFLEFCCIFVRSL